MIKLIPIVTPNIDWSNYLLVSNQVLGESLSDSFDAAKIPPGPRAFTVSLNDLSENSPAIELTDLKHLTYTFLVAMLIESYYILMESVNLQFSSSKSSPKLIVMSGTLEQWQRAVIICTTHSNVDIKMFAFKIKAYFESIGLEHLWKTLHPNLINYDPYKNKS